jgi:hypothetical protein
MSHRQQERVAAQLGLRPVCNKGSVSATATHDDGRQQGHCENHEPFVFLVRDSESEPWRVAPSG